MPAPLPAKRLERLVARLDIALDAPICLACLCIVAGELESTPQKLNGAARCIARDMWDEGLADVALSEVRRIASRGDPDAGLALADLEQREGRSKVAVAIVIRLARQLDEQGRRDAALLRRARERAEGVVPELN